MQRVVMCDCREAEDGRTISILLALHHCKHRITACAHHPCTELHVIRNTAQARWLPIQSHKCPDNERTICTPVILTSSADFSVPRQCSYSPFRVNPALFISLLLFSTSRQSSTLHLSITHMAKLLAFAAGPRCLLQMPTLLA